MHTKKRLFLTLLLLCSANIAGLAQSAQEVLDQTASKLKGSGGLQASFEATTFQGLTPSGSATGTIYVQGEKFQIASDQAATWFDGKTMWSLLKGSNEVNVSNPTPEEIQAINPYTFINLYKKGYKATLHRTDYQGKSCHELNLLSKNKRNAIEEMRIVIDKASSLPLSIRLRQGKNWTRIRVNSLSTGKAWNDSFFRFNSKDHPGTEVIDLR